MSGVRAYPGLACAVLPTPAVTSSDRIPSETPRLQIENLSYNYGAKAALSDVSFAVHGGQFCALLGPNGAGKSTLFALLTRLLVPPKGNILISGTPLRQNPRAALSKIGIVFQKPTLDLDLSVERNLFYFAALQGLSKTEAAPRITEALERLGMAERAQEKTRSLNGGHRRRMELARALIHRPSLLLLDEPTVGLDAVSRTAITEYVHGLTREGLAVLWATHLVDEIEDQDQVLLLHQGRIAAHQTALSLRGSSSLSDRFKAMTAPE